MPGRAGYDTLPPYVFRDKHRPVPSMTLLGIQCLRPKVPKVPTYLIYEVRSTYCPIKAVSRLAHPTRLFRVTNSSPRPGATYRGGSHLAFILVSQLTCKCGFRLIDSCYLLSLSFSRWLGRVVANLAGSLFQAPQFGVAIRSTVVAQWYASARWQASLTWTTLGHRDVLLSPTCLSK